MTRSPVPPGVTFIRVLVGAALVVSFGIAAITLAAIGAVGAPTRVPTCASSGPLTGLSPGQAANARVIADVGSARGGRRAAVIAVMVAIAESSLLVLSNPHDPAGGGYPSQGSGSDHDSLGLFQQRPAWGSGAQRMDPVASTNLFLDALLAVPGWQDQPPWEVAQHVQRSAFDGRPSPSNGGSGVLGGNYLTQLPGATAIVDEIQFSASAQDCGASAGGTVEISGNHHGLPIDYTLPPGTSAPAGAAVQYALAQLGKPYVWGAVGPDSYDCSGLTQAAWNRAGVSISRTTWDQVRDGSPTDLDHLSVGDLVLTPGSDGSLAAPGHVGLYLGAGFVVEAPRTGDVVKVVTLSSFTAKGTSALRHIA